MCRSFADAALEEASVVIANGYFRSISASNPNDGSRRLVLIQVDQQLAEGPRLGVAPELADPIGAAEVGKA